jgi:CRP-like cAMP-binding protein
MPKQVQYKAGSVIYFTGDAADKIFVLQSGMVHLVSQDIEIGQENRELVAPNEFFGILSAYGGFPRDEDAMVSQDATVMVLTVNEFETFAVKNIPMVVKLLKVYSHQLRQINTYFSRVQKNETSDPEAGLFNVGIYYYNRKRLAQAKEVFNRYLAHYPTGTEAVTVLKYLRIIESSTPTKSAPAGKQAAASPEDAGSASLSRFGRTFQPGEIIFSEYEPGDTFYMIQSGSVELTKIVGDIEKKITILHASDVFGEMAILEDSPRSAMAIAMEAVQVLEFNRQNFEILLQNNAQIAMKLLKTFTARIKDAKRRFMILTLDNLDAKVMDVFLMLHENQGRELRDERREFNITIEEVARWAGISIKDAKNTLSRFVSQGRMVLYSDRVIVNNMVECSRIVSAIRRKQVSIEGKIT